MDLIHTNGGAEDQGFLGMNAAVGHADFYPNGGKFETTVKSNHNRDQSNLKILRWDEIRPKSFGCFRFKLQVSN